MNALLIEFDLSTGERAGGINPKDPGLLCHGWQDLESEQAIEIRLVKDGRDLAQYESQNGVTVLRGKKAINKAIVDNIPVRYGIQDMSLLIAHMKEREESLSRFAGKTPNELAKQAFEDGLAGVTQHKPLAVK